MTLDSTGRESGRVSIQSETLFPPSVKWEQCHPPQRALTGMKRKTTRHTEHEHVTHRKCFNSGCT